MPKEVQSVDNSEVLLERLPPEGEIPAEQDDSDDDLESSFYPEGPRNRAKS